MDSSRLDLVDLNNEQVSSSASRSGQASSSVSRSSVSRSGQASSSTSRSGVSRVDSAGSESPVKTISELRRNMRGS